MKLYELIYNGTPKRIFFRSEDVAAAHCEKSNREYAEERIATVDRRYEEACKQWEDGKIDWDNKERVCIAANEAAREKGKEKALELGIDPKTIYFLRDDVEDNDPFFDIGFGPRDKPERENFDYGYVDDPYSYVEIETED